MSDNIKVVVKVRPLIPREVEDKLPCQWRVKNNTLYQLDQNGKESGQCFTFDKVYDKGTKTSNVYEDIAKPIIESAIVGINGTIFAYGQTSSGKTYTMTGTEESPGIIPLSVYNLFDKIQNIPDRDFLLRVSYIEIYNEKIKDLLDVENDNIKVHETVEGVKLSATEKVVTTPDELLDYMKEGNANRQIGTTNMNEKSSRSHSIFQITIESREHAEDEAEAEIGCVNVSQLNLVDLAGSERAAQTGATGSRFKEGTFINKSLSVLGLVIKQLSEDNKFINYRDCKLTRILQNSLGGNAKTSIICAITPATMEETLSTLQFANRAKAIKNKPEVNAVSTNATMIQKLTKQLAKLQYELESKRYLEQDNILLTMKIDSLQRQILNSFNQKSQSDVQAKNRRKTWCAPRRATISTLHPIQEDQQDIDPPAFSTPAHKQFPFPMETTSFKSLIQSAQINRVSGMSNISEESTVTSEKHDTRNSEIIQIESDEEENMSQPCSPYHKCYGTTKTPPCILRDKAKKAEKMYQDIIDFTEREKVYPPNVVEYMQRVEQHQSAISNLEDKISTLNKECQEKDKIIKLLENKVTESEEQINSITSNKQNLEEMCQEFNTKLTDLEVSYEILKKKAKTREKELLSLLGEEKANLLKGTENVPEEKRNENESHSFINTFKDVLHLKSDNYLHINNIKEDDGVLQIQELVSQLQDQLSHRSNEIIKLQEEIEHKNQRILNLENFYEEIEEKVANSNHKIVHLEAENCILKSSMEMLNSTIENQKINLDNLHLNEKSYNNLIASLQVELDDNSENKTLKEKLDDNKLELMFSNETKLVENNEHIKNVIDKLKNLIHSQKLEIKELKSRLDSVSTYCEDNNSAELCVDITNKEKQITQLNEELLKFKNETDRNIIEINRLTQENSTLLKCKQDMLKESSDIELQCKNLKNVVDQKNAEIDNLISDLGKAELNINDLTDKKMVTEERNKELTIELQILERKMKELEGAYKDESEKQKLYFINKNKEIITEIQEVLSLLNETSSDEKLEINDVNETFEVFKKRINLLESLITDMKSQNLALINNNDKLKAELLEAKEKYENAVELVKLDMNKIYTTRFSEAADKLKEIISVISDRPSNDEENSVEGAFDNLNNYIQVMKPVVMSLKSQNEDALKNAMELKEKHQCEIQTLQSHINLIQNQKNAMENESASLVKKYEDMLVDFENAKISITAKDQANTELVDKINTLSKINATLQSELASCNDKISLLRGKEIELKSHIAHLEDSIMEKADQYKRNTNLEQLDIKLKCFEDIFLLKLKTILQLLVEKDSKISELAQNLHVIKNNLENRRLEMDKRNHTLESRLAYSEKIKCEVTCKLKQFLDLLHIDSFASFDSNEDDNETYSEIPHFLNKVYSVVKDWKKELSECKNAKEELMHLQSSYDILLQNLDEVNNKYKLSLIEIEELKSENVDLNNNLLQKSEQFESQKIEMRNLYSSIRELRDQIKSLQEHNTNLQSKNKRFKDRELAEFKNKRNEDKIYKNMNTVEEHTITETRNSILKDSNLELKCPRTLISICCNKIGELLSSNEFDISEKLSTSCSEIKIDKKTFQTLDNSSYTCTCNDNSYILTLQHDYDQLKEEVQSLRILRQNLVVERDECKEEIASVISLSTELQKKITNHRTNLSTLTATTYAENKLLKSQVKVLQYHLKRIQNMCQRDIPYIKAQLSELFTILQNDPNYFKSPIFCDKLYTESITSDTKSAQILPHFNSTVDTDLLMLDTNVTFASDNTLVANNQTNLDLSQTFYQSDFEKQFAESRVTSAIENFIVNDIVSTLKQENNTINIQLSKDQIEGDHTEVKNADMFISNNLVSTCNCEYKLNEIQKLLNTKIKEVEDLQVKLVTVKQEKDNLTEKLSSKSLSIDSTNKIKELEQDCLHRTNEINKLQNSIRQKNEELKLLQGEVDSLSTEVMDNISEVETLRKQLDSFQDNNSELNQKCLKLERILAEKDINVCQECLTKDEFIKKLQSSQLVHCDDNCDKKADKEPNTDFERYNKIEKINKNLQNELDASLEDCQKITDEFATIKSHLEKCNLSNNSNINLDDTNIYSITKTVRSPERRRLSKLTLTAPEIDVEMPSIDLYVCEKIECLNFYAEKMGVEKENLNHDIKIIDIMRMFYNNLIVKHGNEVENLLNKLKDFETSKCLLKENFDQLSLDYDRVTLELEEKNNRIKSLSDITLVLNNNIKEFQVNIINSENCAELVSQFKDKILNTIDTEFSISIINSFEQLIDNIANKQEKELANIMLKYTQLKDHMEKLMVEQTNLNENLVYMKNQLVDKESKYNTLKMQKEKIHEINNAVTLDIIKKEEELSNIITEGWQILINHNIIKIEDDYAKLPLNKSVQKLFDKCIHMHQKYNAIQKKESEIEKFKIDIKNRDDSLQDKTKECELLKNHLDTIEKINQSISSELHNKEEQLRQLTLLYEEVSQKCQSQSIELITNSSRVNDLNKDISALKELLDQQDNTIKCLEIQIQTCEMDKHIAKQKELELSTMIQEMQVLQRECSQLKTVNIAITKEKEHYSMELEQAGRSIKEQNEELLKIGTQINDLREMLNEKIKEIEKLQEVGKIVLEENDNLRRECATLKRKIKEVSQQYEEKENDYKRLEINLKTHEKSAEIQNNIIKKLQKQKEDDRAIFDEKEKSLEEKNRLIQQLNEKCTDLLKKYELVSQQLKENRINLENIVNSKEIFEGCLRGLESEMEGVRSGRSSLEAETRRRRRSHHDAQRTIDDRHGEEEMFTSVLDSVDQKRTVLAHSVSNNSSGGGSTRLSSRRESECERNDKIPNTDKEDSNCRLSEVGGAARRRRQSTHDLLRSVRSPVTPNDTLNLSYKERKHVEHQSPEEMQRELLELRDEVENLRERCKELDEECDQCAEAVHDREREIVQLSKENENLEAKLEELSKKLNDSKPNHVEIAVNTDEDWSNLHAVVVDRMSYDAEIEKNRKLTRALEESQRRVRELRAAVDAARNDNALVSELKNVKSDFEACRLKYEDLKRQHKALLTENAATARRLHDLEELLKKEDDKENRIVDSARQKRRSVHDQNRPRDHEFQEEHLMEIQRLKEELERQSRMSTLTVATGSAIVQNQQMSDIMKENHKLRKLVSYLRKKSKNAPDVEVPMP